MQCVSIDIFSQGLLNPFSATLQCADAMLAGATLHQDRCRSGVPEADELIDSTQATLMCLQHHKRIIDDVLAHSKAESLTLAVVPARVRLHESTVHTVRIFPPELRTKDIYCTLVIEPWYTKATSKLTCRSWTKSIPVSERRRSPQRYDLD